MHSLGYAILRTDKVHYDYNINCCSWMKLSFHPFSLYRQILNNNLFLICNLISNFLSTLHPLSFTLLLYFSFSLRLHAEYMFFNLYLKTSESIDFSLKRRNGKLTHQHPTLFNDSVHFRRGTEMQSNHFQ